MVFLPTEFGLTKDDVVRIVGALEAKLAQYPGEDDLADGETWL